MCLLVLSAAPIPFSFGISVGLNKAFSFYFAVQWMTLIFAVPAICPLTHVLHRTVYLVHYIHIKITDFLIRQY